ncbi:hypothetical protein [Streptomyces sp. NPDC059575]|uniref:hypothetical protein n=1 Tax=Streptomyces sp. NPDC059575 TaxID=3346872 RepID=UPI0036A1723A
MIAAGATLSGVPCIPRAEGGGGFRQEIGVFRRPKPWLVLSTSTLTVGLALNSVFLTGFALLADLPVPAVLCVLGIGLADVTMNPAMATRATRPAPARHGHGSGGPGHRPAGPRASPSARSR